MAPKPKPDGRRTIVSKLHSLACEIHQIALHVEETSTLDQVESRITGMPGAIDVLRKATAEAVNARYDKALEILSEVSIEIGNDKLVEVEAKGS
jgi:hypothetical protein